MKRARVVFEKILETVTATVVVALAVVVVVGVAFRKAGSALVWYDEVAAILLAWLTYYGAALVALRRGHIGVPVLVERLSGGPRIVAVLTGEVAVIGFFVVLAWAGLQVQAALSGVPLVSLPAVPTAVAQSVIPIGAVLFVIAQLLSLPDALRGKTGGGDH